MTDEAKPLVFEEAADAEKPPFDEELRPFIDKALKRHKRRPPNPAVFIEKDGAQDWTFGAAHADLEAWQIQIFDAFGTRSMSAVLTFLHQLAALCIGEVNYGPKGWAPDENELNAAINMVSGIRPANEVQAALAAQMVAVHLMMMKLSAQSMRHGHVDARSMAIAGKLARTFAQQAEAITKLQGRSGRQRIIVKNERHIHRHEHKHLHASEGGGSISGGRPYEPNTHAHSVPAIENEACSALPCPDAAGDRVPVPGSEDAD